MQTISEISQQTDELLLFYVYFKYLRGMDDLTRFYDHLKNKFSRLSKSQIDKYKNKFYYLISNGSIDQAQSNDHQTQNRFYPNGTDPSKEDVYGIGSHTANRRMSNYVLTSDRMTVSPNTHALQIESQENLEPNQHRSAQTVLQKRQFLGLEPDSPDSQYPLPSHQQRASNFSGSNQPILQNTIQTKMASNHQISQNHVTGRAAEDLPTGIINMGNTCYSSCILQILYHYPGFAKPICKFRIDEAKKSRFENLAQTLKNSKSQSGKHQLILNGSLLIETLQNFFYQLTAAGNNQADPSDVLSKMVSRDGNELFAIGKQEDVVEFMNCAFDLIEAGLELDQRVTSLIVSTSRVNGSI